MTRYTVFAGVRSDRHGQELKKEAEEIKVDLQPILVDVTKRDTIAESLATVKGYLAKSGAPFVGLVNNAGVNTKAQFPVEFSSLEEVKRVYEVNVFGLMDITKAYIPLLRQHHGRVVNIGSLAGVMSRPFTSIYSGSKFALTGFNDALRREMRPFNVSVSLVQPAYIQSVMMENKVAQENPFQKALSEEEYKLYRNHFDNYYTKSLAITKIAGPPSLTSEVILDALRNPQPRPVYSVGPISSVLSASALEFLLWVLPTPVLDAVFERREKV